MKSIESTRTPEQPLQTRLQRVLQDIKASQFGRYRDGATFDVELFKEAYERMEQELHDLSPEQRRQVFQDFYFDSIPTSMDWSDRRGSRFIDEYITEPPIIALETAIATGEGLQGGSNAALEGWSSHRSYDYTSRVILYGPVRVVDVIPGDWAVQRMDAYSVIGSSEFTACQAIVGRTDSQMALAHSTYGCESGIPAIVAKFRELLGPSARLHYFYPRQEMSSALKEGTWVTEETMAQHNARAQTIAEHNGLEAIPFYYVDSWNNPDDVGASSIIVSKDGVQVIGHRLAVDPLTKK